MSAKLTLHEIRKLAGQFAKRWEGTSQENSNTQVFWTEFFAIFGVDSKRVVLFERHAERLSTGSKGRIDVFWPGELLVEQKSLGKSLKKATEQAFDYLDGLSDPELPKIVVVSDFEKFEVHDLTSGDVTVTQFTLKQLPRFIGLFTWIAGYTRRPSVALSEEVANKKAVRKMSDLYQALVQDNLSDHHTSVYLARILFLLFGEDTGLIERGLFAQTIRDRSDENGSDLGGLLSQLFRVLDTAPEKRSLKTDELLLRFPFVNGSVFSEPLPPANFDARMRHALLSATDFEWGTISPAIFGSMFQAVKSKELRRELGEHYTTERDILKTLGPLFLDELQSEFKSNQFNASKLNALWDKIAGLRFLDPACGCGNFLIVTYRELRELELRILERLQELTGHGQTSMIDESMGLKVSLSQFTGIEIEEWPARIAEVALFITDHQANRRMVESIGTAPDRLPLKIQANIVTGNALKIDWRQLVEPSEDVRIFGNPPYLGKNARTPSQMDELSDAWGGLLSKQMDYVTAWHAKTLSFFGEGVNGRWAFVTTSSICQGEPVPALFGPILKAKWRISFAHRNFIWTSEATGKAGVHVSIVGFSRQSTERPRLFTYPEGGQGEATEQVVTNINPYLTEGPDLLVHKRSSPLSPLLPPVLYGNKPTDGSNLIVEPQDYQEVASDPHAAKYLKRYIGARELIHGNPRWCLWLTELDPADVAESHVLKARVDGVRQMRLASKGAAARLAAATPHLFWWISHPSTNYLAIARNPSERRPFYLADRLTPETVSSDQNYIAEDPDGFLFGLISSSLFLTWQKTVGGRLRSDLRFSNTLVWNNFPVPQSASPAQRQAVVDAAAEVLAARELQEGRSLAEMYQPLAMRAELVKAHRGLDGAMARLFGARKVPETEADRQKLLFRAYLELQSATDAASLRGKIESYAKDSVTPGEDAEALVKGLLRVFTAEDAWKWLSSKDPVLKTKPIQVLKSGQTEEVMKVVDSLGLQLSRGTGPSSRRISAGVTQNCCKLNP